MKKYNETTLGLKYYGSKKREEYNKVVELAKKNNLSKSAAGRLLIKQGLIHMNNPKPLIKEKPVYERPYPACENCNGKPQEKIVCRTIEVPVEKVVYRDKPNQKNANNEKNSMDKWLVGGIIALIGGIWGIAKVLEYYQSKSKANSVGGAISQETPVEEAEFLDTNIVPTTTRPNSIPDTSAYNKYHATIDEYSCP